MTGLPRKDAVEAPANAGAFCSFSRNEEEETIAAIATALGTAGVSIVRISGPLALTIAGELVRLRSDDHIPTLRGWSIALGTVADPASGDDLDEVILLVMRAPRSYTGEDIVEIQCHGGQLVTEKILSLVFSLGARQATPGEFTRRAYLNGRISLDEAEAVLDIVGASSEDALTEAAKRLKGGLGEKLCRFEDGIMKALSELLGGADFPEDVEDLSVAAFSDLNIIAFDMKSLLESAPLGLALTAGVEVCLVGKPNAGKSSLFNALLGDERAIVTDMPGTTRDVLSERVEWHGLPVVLKDTAGLRETSQVVETIGVERARQAAEGAEVILYVVDDSAPLDDEDLSYLQKWRGRRLLVVVTKTDLGAGKVSVADLDALGLSHVRVSAVSKMGLDQVRDAIAKWFARDEHHGVLLGSARQVDCLRRAYDALSSALRCHSEGWTLDVIVQYLEECAGAFAELTGKKVSEEILEQVFSRFCVGK